MFVLLYFAFTLFVSALLLFLVQPMIGKMILPKLGGSPAVWNTCMVFFQMMLLLGYGYTHFVTTRLKQRAQLILQLIILCLPLAVLPFSLGEWSLSTETNPILPLLGRLLLLVGLPFFVVATSAPLLQKWFTNTGHPAGKDPYFLYGASNLGSMLALLLYPTAVEPFLPVKTSEGGGWLDQTVLWTIGYATLMILVVGCAVFAWRPKLLLAAGMPNLDPSPEPMPSAEAGVLAPTAIKTTTSTSNVPAGAVKAGAPPSGGVIQRKASGRRSETAVSASGPGGRRRMRLQDALPTPSSSVSDQDDLPYELSGEKRPMSWGRRLRWIGLAAVPSSLMLGVTTHLTTDVAAIPLFWVIPLALYLLTFILVFMRWPVTWTGWPHTFILYLQPCLLLVMALVIVGTLDTSGWSNGLAKFFGLFTDDPPKLLVAPVAVTFYMHIFTFFVSALMCHGELARDRPSTKHLTEFYLCMSVGGVLGGLFNAFFAPMVFWFGIVEYPVAMVLSLLLRPSIEWGFAWERFVRKDLLLRWGVNVLVPLAMTLAIYLVVKRGAESSYRSLFTATLVVVLLLVMSRPIAMAGALAAILCVIGMMDRINNSSNVIFQDRSFFSYVRIRQEQGQRVEDGGTCNVLIHGGIDHGRQYISGNGRYLPISYFDPSNAIGQIFNGFSFDNARLPASLVGMGNSPLSALVNTQSNPPYAVLGLGAGTLAAHARPFQHVDIYEIDPLVKRLSLPAEGEERYFFYVQDALDRKANLSIIMGDGRLKMKEVAPEKYYHAICVDAFSSDSIPMHLLTKEALELYLSKLAPGGVIVFNTTNRYVDLRPILGDDAKTFDLNAWAYSDYEPFGGWSQQFPDKFSTDFVMLQPRIQDQSSGNYCGSPLTTRKLWHGYSQQDYWGHWDSPGPDIDILAGWKDVVGPGWPAWTDNYSNLFRAMDLGF